MMGYFYYQFAFFLNLAESMRKIKDLHRQFWKFLVGCFNIKNMKNKIYAYLACADELDF
jgi:hypothetical protein